MENKIKNDYEWAEQQFVSGHAKEAFPVIAHFAEQGNLRAAYLLACFYHMGYGVVQNDPERRNSLCVQAESGDDLLLVYGYASWCLKKDQSEQQMQIFRSVFDGLLKQAESGDLLAQYIIGKMYMDGNAVDQDYNEAAKWLKDGAASGYAAAQTALGWLCGENDDTAKAIELYSMAAEQEYANAQVNLGIAYAEGIGVPPDDAEAIRWYQKAADQGYAPALLNLGWHYDNGQGVDEDTQKALEYYQKAAERGNITAMYNLVNIYRRGIDTERSIEQAAEWYLRAQHQQYSEVSETYESIMEYFRGLDDSTVIWPQ